MKPNDLAAMLALPMAARVEYEHEGGWSFATHSNGTEAKNWRTLFDETQMRAYALAHIVAERERPRQVLAYMATSREGKVRFTDNPDAARELEGYGWAITPLADAGPNVNLTGAR